MHTDYTGMWSISSIFAGVAVVAAAVAVVAACVVAAPVMATVGTIAVSTAAAAVANTAATVAVAAAVTAVVANKVEQTQKSYTVYTLSDPSTNDVVYVGRTSDYKSRIAAHGLNPARKDLVPAILYEDLDYLQARATEQAYILHYATIDKNQKSHNQINGVNPNRLDYTTIMRKGFGISEALDSILTNEILIAFES